MSARREKTFGDGDDDDVQRATFQNARITMFALIIYSRNSYAQVRAADQL